MILLNADAILASSILKSGESLRPSIDCDVIRSSYRFRHLHFIDPRHCEMTERCTHRKSSGSGNVPKCNSEIACLGFPSNNFENKFLQYDA